MHTHLHYYRCSFCKATATHPVLVKGMYRCTACLRILAYLYSEPIVTDEQRERAGGGLVFSTPDYSGPPVRRRKCVARGCANYGPEAAMVQLPGIGWFCSQAHAVQGQQEWDAFMDRLRALKAEKPWLEIPALTTHK